MGMLKQYFKICLLISATIGFSLGLHIKVSWEQSKFIIAAWEDDPIVVVCPDSELTKYRVSKAVEWWAIRGYKVNHIQWDKDNDICSQGRWSKGVIFIRSEGELLPDTYAITSRLTILNEMISAEITIPNEERHRPLLLEHEFGHAFGMRHVEQVGHIMHPIHEHGGEKFWIPD